MRRCLFVGKIKDVIQVTDRNAKKKYFKFHKNHEKSSTNLSTYREERKLFFLRTQKEELPFFV